MANGEFDDLACKGKPVDLTSYFEVHEDLRMAYSILKNASVLPPEVELLKEIESLKEQARTCCNARERERLERMASEQLLKFNLLVEGSKRARRSGRF
jgi:DnaJ-like protein